MLHMLIKKNMNTITQIGEGDGSSIQVNVEELPVQTGDNKDENSVQIGVPLSEKEGNVQPDEIGRKGTFQHGEKDFMPRQSW